MKRKRVKGLLMALVVSPMILVSVIGCANGSATPLPVNKTLTVFSGAASKPALDEAAQFFEKQTGIKVYPTYGGSGAVLSQMELSKSGDLYIPGSPDYAVKAERDGVIDPESVKVISYLVPVIAVQKGNPKNVRTLADLARPGIKVAIGNPEAVCLGLYAVEILEYNGLLDRVAITTEAESCEKLATLVVLKAVDAVIGWHVFRDWNPDNIDIVYLEPEQIPRLAYIPAAISTFTRDRESARKFVAFLVSPPAQQIFAKWGYITSEGEARKFAPNAEIGGEYTLPSTYRSRIR